jgi:hypothetical protein
MARSAHRRLARLSTAALLLVNINGCGREDGARSGTSAPATTGSNTSLSNLVDVVAGLNDFGGELRPDGLVCYFVSSASGGWNSTDQCLEGGTVGIWNLREIAQVSVHGDMSIGVLLITPFDSKMTSVIQRGAATQWEQRGRAAVAIVDFDPEASPLTLEFTYDGTHRVCEVGAPGSICLPS